MTELKTTIYHKSGRIDKVLTDLLSNYSRSQIQLWLKERAVSVNGEPVKASYKVKQGDGITVLIPEPETLDVIPESIPLTIVYEDEDVAVINKPQGIAVHPSANHAYDTMINALIYHVRDPFTIGGVIRPGIAHRIDEDTPGLLMVAKNGQAHESSTRQSKNKTSLHKYIALVHGEIPHEKGTINAPIGRSKENRRIQTIREDGKPAATHLTVLERFEGFTLVELRLETGRTHQTRVHMKYIGYPLAGDPVYGPKKTLKSNGQFLRAQILGFTHPTTNGKMIFEVSLPEVFEKTLEKLGKNIAF